MTPDNNEWAGLGDELAKSEQTDATSTADATDDGANTDEDTTDSGPTETDPAEPPSERTTDERLETPAFSYDECQQGGLHPRAEQWQTYEVGRSMARSRLAEQGLTSVEKRELDDAVLRLAKQKYEELARLVIEAQGIVQPRASSRRQTNAPTGRTSRTTHEESTNPTHAA